MDEDDNPHPLTAAYGSWLNGSVAASRAALWGCFYWECVGGGVGVSRRRKCCLERCSCAPLLHQCVNEKQHQGPHHTLVSGCQETGN